MLTVIASLPRVLAVMALAAVTTSSVAPVVWAASAPGEDLQPVGSAAESVLVTQNGDRVLWVSTEDAVATVMTLGWEQTGDEVELGGALTIETVYRTTGSLSIGEPPKSVSFDFEG